MERDSLSYNPSFMAVPADPLFEHFTRNKPRHTFAKGASKLWRDYYQSLSIQTKVLIKRERKKLTSAWHVVETDRNGNTKVTSPYST